MSGKRHKQLRRLARMHMAALPERDYGAIHHRKVIVAGGVAPVEIVRSQRCLGACKRKATKHLKRADKASRRGDL